MERAVMEERLSPEIRSGIVGDLEKVVLSDREVKKAAQLLSRIDPKQAETFLLSDRVMDTESGSLHEVLGVIGEFDFPIPREKVKSLVATYAGREMEYPNTYALGESLELLGKFQNREDEELLLEYADHDEDRVSDGAAAGLLAFHGLEDFQECMWEQEEAGGWESLNHQQQLYLAVFLLNAEVNNGGHSQYFFNSTGDSWPLALEGLQTMGFRKRLQIFEGVLELFGDQKPLTDRDKRLDQLAKVFRQNEDAFDAFDSQYYAAEESFDVYSMRFVIQNADKFSERPADTP
ncbi:hypothetical protein C5Y93_15325 [Blastopirellula marina]|uniref:DNA mimic protein DMP19 C-terminal domain-containing protein n=2 Tax=Blastopirellula marina TaxID=124 RepID=A0A2S8GLP5_9BACT|nr:hypothetical protein C5Y93_15325 [Blastopirellula marina]